MKKLIVLILSAVLVFAFAGCGDSGSSEETPSDSGALGDYEVAIKDCEIVKDYEDNDTASITYDFTNNSDDSMSFDGAFIYKVFQDGEELDFTSVYPDEDSFDATNDKLYTDIQPGKTIEVTSTNKLNSTEDDVTVEVEEFLGEGDKLTKTFKIAK